MIIPGPFPTFLDTTQSAQWTTSRVKKPFANERLLLWRLFFLSVLYHFLRVVADLGYYTCVFHHKFVFLQREKCLFYKMQMI